MTTRPTTDAARASFAAERAEARPAVCERPGCTEPLSYAGRGRPRTVCGETCKKAVYRLRLKTVAAYGD